MSTLSDVQALYASAQNVWTKSRVHIVSHVVVIAVVFGICGATLPNFSGLQFDHQRVMDRVMDNDWYKIGKDLGLIYAVIIIPVVLIVAYVAVLRAVGSVLAAVVMLIFPYHARRNFSLLSSSVLVPLALVLEKSDFDLTDLQNRANDLVLRYRKDDQWKSFEESISGKNWLGYFGDFLVFLVLWIALFKLVPETPWTKANACTFQPVAVILLGLAVFTWLRVLGAITVLPDLLLMFVATMVGSDPDMKALLESRKGRAEQVGERLDKLLSDERTRQDDGPSLLAFLKSKFGFDEKASLEEHRVAIGGWPLSACYRDGLEFSWDKTRYSNFGNRWLSGYLAYLYYRLHNWLTSLAKTILIIVRLLITGTIGR
jgi:hypothetical protein